MRRLLLPRTVPAVLAALTTLVVALPGASAAAPEAQGWWYRARSAELPIETPVPPTVDDDGLYVATGPTGAIGIAALRAPVGDVSQATVTLELTDSTGTVLIGACRTEPWFPVQAGNWEERPAPDCDSGAVIATVSEDGATATIDATSLVDGGVLDISLIPGENEDGTPANFTASIAPPGPDTVSTSSAGSTAPTTTSTTAQGIGATPEAEPFVAPAPTSSSFRPASGVIAPPEPETAIEIPPQAQEVAAPITPRPAVSTPGGPASDSGRLLALGLIAAMGAAYVVLRGRQGPLPAPLLAIGRGSTTPSERPTRTVTSGVGRFARERTGRPPPLT